MSKRSQRYINALIDSENAHRAAPREAEQREPLPASPAPEARREAEARGILR